MPTVPETVPMMRRRRPPPPPLLLLCALLARPCASYARCAPPLAAARLVARAIPPSLKAPGVEGAEALAVSAPPRGGAKYPPAPSLRQCLVFIVPALGTDTP